MDLQIKIKERFGSSVSNSVITQSWIFSFREVHYFMVDLIEVFLVLLIMREGKVI